MTFIYGSYKLLKTVRFFGPPCTCSTCPEANNMLVRYTSAHCFIIHKHKLIYNMVACTWWPQRT